MSILLSLALAAELGVVPVPGSELADGVELFVHLMRPEKTLPPGASETNAEGWVRLSLK